MDQQSGEAMVGMVIVRPVGDDQIGIYGADQADDVEAILGAVVKLAVGLVEDGVCRANHRGGGLRLGLADGGESGAIQLLMPSLAVGETHQPDGVPEGRPFGRRSTRLDIGVIGVSANHKNPQ